MTDLAIRCRNLIKTYPSKPPIEAVRGLDLQVPRGQCFGLLGPNGAGKTTTLEILEGILTATSGEVEILGLTWSQNETELRSKIGISLQETRLPDKLTVFETVKLFRSMYPNGITPEAAIQLVSLEEKNQTYVVRLSGGQRQRLAVACALVGQPDLLFLDEPTTGLDPQSRRQLWEVIQTYRDSGRTVVITTHYMDEAERLCDQVAIIDGGKIIAQGSPKDLIHQLGGEHIIEFSLSNHATCNQEDLIRLKTVQSVRHQDGSYQLTASEPHLALPALLDLLRQQNLQLAGVTTRFATLEDVFVNLTGRHLRDAE